jgi:SAM-dependent methyltransferase
MTHELHKELRGLLGILRSPISGDPLILREDSLQTEGGDERYRITNGIPILLAPGKSLFGDTDILISRPSTVFRRARSRLRRTLIAGHSSSQNLRHLGALLEPTGASRDGSRRVLVVGGGILGFGVEELEACEWIELVETDVYIGPRTSIVCDAHDLPFDDGVFHAVVIQAVLEHVIDPVRVVSELHRVLAGDGLIYSEIPFMQQVHEGAYDFTRWTLGGHRRLLRDFDEISAGAVGGAGEALAWSIRYFLLACIGDNARSRRLAGLIAVACTLPLRWIDRIICDRPASVDAASGTFVLGRRRATPRADADIVSAYGGTQSDLVR